MMATVPHVTSGLGLRKFQADGILLTRVYVLRNIEARSCNHGCSGISITYNGSVSVPLGIQHVMRMRHTVNCDLSDSTMVFPLCFISVTIFGKQF